MLLGKQVQNAFSVAPGLSPLDCYWKQHHRVRLVPRTQAPLTCFYLVPHPSGRNLWYNEDSNRRMVAALLGRLYVNTQGELRSANLQDVRKHVIVGRRDSEGEIHAPD